MYKLLDKLDIWLINDKNMIILLSLIVGILLVLELALVYVIPKLRK